MINDISDHLPVFAMYDCHIKKNNKQSCKRYVRVRSDEAINQFRNDLLKEEWKGVYVEEVNAAYDLFMSTYLSPNDKQCPIKNF